jgi:ABC-type lipoprotein export system ATPase subunit
VIIVTHDSRIFEFADTLARMDDGHIVSVERKNGHGGRVSTSHAIAS